MVHLLLVLILFSPNDHVLGERIATQVEASLVTHTLVPEGTPLKTAKQIAALMTLDTYPLTMDIPTMQRVSNAMFEFDLEPGLKQPYNILNMIQSEPGMIR